MRASPILTSVLADRLSVTAEVVGALQPPAGSGAWAEELQLALPSLHALADRIDQVFSAGDVPITAIGRCAAALATLPVVARHRPDAVVLWFDAHADLNTPDVTTTGYLGGLAFSGPLGLWDSTLGAGLSSQRAILVGARDIDPAEQEVIDRGDVAFVPVGATVASELAALVAGRPVYVHIDCDVLEPGEVPTEYLVPGGLTLDDLRECALALAGSELVGIEIGELQVDPTDEESLAPARDLVAALEPLFRALDR